VLRGPEYYRDIEEINRSFSFDIMIADNCFTGISFVKQLLGKPVIAIGVVPLPETSKDLPPSGLGLTPSSTFFGRRIQDIMRLLTDKFVFGESKRLIDHIYDEHGMRKIKGNLFDVICREADLLLQSGTPGFEYYRSDLGKNVRFIGPLLPYNEKKQERYQLHAAYNQYQKKILVTQGTVETDVEKIIVPTLEAFKNSDVLVVVTTGGSKTQELRARYPFANVLIEDFIPFSDIMPACDVYVSNGGYGGVLLSVQNKLPMVVAGVHEGKNEINARVGYFKLGINLRTEKPSPSQIKTNVEIVLRDAIYKDNVNKLAEEFEQYNPAWRSESYVNELLLKREKSTRATFLRMITKHAEEKVY
jgi:UDP:flavonoid glycosyltransferase YjiC (YdhE family)